MNTATPPPPGSGRPDAAEARMPGHEQPPLCSSMPPGWMGLAGRLAEAIELALAAAPGDAARSSMTPMLMGALDGPDLDPIVAPTWWLEWHARVEHAELVHLVDAVDAAVTPTLTHA